MASAAAKRFNCNVFALKFILFLVYGWNVYSRLKFITLTVLTVSWRTFLAISARTGATRQVTFFSSSVQRTAQARMWTEHNSNEGKTETRIMFFTVAACVDYIGNATCNSAQLTKHKTKNNKKNLEIMMAASLWMHLMIIFSYQTVWYTLERKNIVPFIFTQ